MGDAKQTDQKERMEIGPRSGGTFGRVSSSIRHHPLAWFFGLAFGLTWMVMVPQLVVPELTALQLVLGWMPGAAAIIVAGVIRGAAGARALLRRLFIWRVDARWYLVAVLGPVALYVVPGAINPLFGGSGLHLPPLSGALLIGAGVQLAVRLVLSSEQLAWSGFALPQLESRYGALRASVLLGAVWAVWHLPLFFVAGSQRDMGFVAFLLATISIRVVQTWVFNGTGGSVLLVSLLHQVTNVVTDVAGPYAAPADQTLNQWIGVGLWAAVAAVLALVYGHRRLSSGDRVDRDILGLPGVTGADARELADPGCYARQRHRQRYG